MTLPAPRAGGRAPEAPRPPRPRPLPADRPPPRKERLTGGRLRAATPGVTAELFKDQGPRRVPDDAGRRLRGLHAGVRGAAGPGRRPAGHRPGRRRSAPAPAAWPSDIDADGKRDSINDIDKGTASSSSTPTATARRGRTAARSRATRPGWERAWETRRRVRGAPRPSWPWGGAGRPPLPGGRPEEPPEPGGPRRPQDSWGLRVRVGGLKGRDRRLTDAGVVRLDLAAGPGRRHEDSRRAGGRAHRRRGGVRRPARRLPPRLRRARSSRKKSGTLAPVSR